MTIAGLPLASVTAAVCRPTMGGRIPSRAIPSRRKISSSGLLLRPDQPDLPPGLLGVKLRALHRNDNEVGKTDRITDQQIRRALQVDNHERGLCRRRFDLVD